MSVINIVVKTEPRYCIKTCSLFYILLVSYIFIFSYCMFGRNDFKKYENLLDKDLLKKYKKIKKERLKHYLIGLSVGSILGLICIFMFSYPHNYCLAGLTLLITSSMIYYFIPKSDYMVYHLKTEEQKRQYQKIGKNFKTRKMIGFVVGIILYLFVPILRK